MAESKKYYWLKLQKDFFKRSDIRVVESMPNGKDYILFYLKMLVESVSHDGELRFSDTIPYNDEMLSVITNTNIDIVRSAMKVFEELKMVSVLEDSTIYMNEVNKMIGKSCMSDEEKQNNAERQKRFRERKKMQLLEQENNDNVTVTLNVTESKSIEIEKEKDLEKEYNSSNQSTSSKEYKLSNQSTSSIAQTSKKESEPEAETEAILLNDGSEWKPTVTMFDEYKRLFPAVDVERQIAAMRAWSLANPSKRKTRSGVNRFVTNWLSKEQNKGGSNSRSGTTRIGSQLSNEEWRQMWEDA